MYLLLMIMKNSYLNLAFVFGSVAVDNDMHFKMSNWKDCHQVEPYT